MTAFFQQPYQLERLVRRDPAADDEEHVGHGFSLAQT
jgi:hypothetical protein